MLSGIQALLIQELLFPSQDRVRVPLNAVSDATRNAALTRAIANCIWQARPTETSAAKFLVPMENPQEATGVCVVLVHVCVNRCLCLCCV